MRAERKIGLKNIVRGCFPFETYTNTFDHILVEMIVDRLDVASTAE